MREKVLVSTDWVLENLENPDVRIVEVDEDVLLYDLWHIPGAVKIDWQQDVKAPDRRDFIDEKGFADLMGRLGIRNDTRVVFYGDKSNWWASYAFWLFRYFGHAHVCIMDGGRKKWELEDKPRTQEIPRVPRTTYQPNPPNDGIRAYAFEILQGLALGEPHRVLIDVRSPQEYTGELIHMPDYPQEGAQIGGHIPGALNIPWAQNVNDTDWTFKSEAELRRIYESRGITPDREVIVYCRVGERSALTWFVLTQLLGYPQVRNYDGSWTEWGNMVRVPVKKGSEP